MTDSTNEDEDMYLAPPGHQVRFERELGGFLVAFNKIEAIVSDLMVLSMVDAGQTRTAMKDKLGCNFGERLRVVREFYKPPADIGAIDYDAITALTQERNALAHGHFEDLQFYDSYTIRQSQKLQTTTRAFRSRELRGLTKQAKRLYDALEAAWADFYLSMPGEEDED